ncbi:MAG: glycine cleavage system protein H [Planctomycetota bacterium]|jgi:glycine cleavage system H protein
MLALLTILTFVVFIALDYFLYYRKSKVVKAAAPEPVTLAPVLTAAEPVWVAGYEMPQDLHYHPGHVWARALNSEVVEVGMDDFARRLVGGVDKVKLPHVGDWMTQGSPAFDVKVGDRTAHLVSPVSGEVVDVNDGVDADEPYRRGWFCRIRNAALADNLRNLLSGGLAARWMEDARKRLEVQLMALSGTVLQDGGEPAPDFARHLEKTEWRDLAEDFLLVQPE